MKVDVSAPRAATLKRAPTNSGRRRARVQQRLVDIDTNHDGVISTEELVDFIEDTVHQEAQLRYLKWAAGLLLVFTVVLLGAIAGLTVGIVIAVKDTKSTGGALADKGSGTTLRTASGGYMRVDISTASNGTSSTGRRLLQDGAAGLTISRAAAAQACTYLSEGHSTFPMTAGTGGTSNDVGNVQIVAEDNCEQLAAGDMTVAAQGVVTYQGNKIKVTCAAGDDQCSFLLLTPVPSASGNNTSAPTSSSQVMGRRLLQGTAAVPGGCDSASFRIPIGTNGTLTPVSDVRKQLLVDIGPQASGFSAQDVCRATRARPFGNGLSFISSKYVLAGLGSAALSQFQQLSQALTACALQVPDTYGGFCTVGWDKPALDRPLDIGTFGALVSTNAALSRDYDGAASCRFAIEGQCVLVPPDGTFTPTYPSSNDLYTAPTYSAVDRAQTNLQPLLTGANNVGISLANQALQAFAKNPSANKGAQVIDVMKRVLVLTNSNPPLASSVSQALGMLATNASLGGCFPSEATVMRRHSDGDMRRVPLSQLTVGDVVQVVNANGTLGTSEVYLFPHFETAGSHSFVEITTAGNLELRLTPNHLVYISGAADQPFTTRRPVPASEVRPGDHVWVATEAEGQRPANAAAAVKTTRVISVRQVVDSGLVNPFTLQGNIVVNGMAASSYTTALGNEAMMHTFTAAGRVLWRRAPWLLRAVHRCRLAQPLSLAIGHFAQKGVKGIALEGGMMQDAAATPLALARRIMS